MELHEALLHLILCYIAYFIFSDSAACQSLDNLPPPLIGCVVFCMQKQADANSGLLMLAALCHLLPLGFRFAIKSGERAMTKVPILDLSRACSFVMLIAYIAFLFFQLKTHRQLFESQEVSNLHQPLCLPWLIAMEGFHAN